MTPIMEVLRLVLDDAHACTFQTMGQYRSALAKYIAALAVDPKSAAATPSKNTRSDKQKEVLT